jgi:hypothetical protein
MGSKTDSTLGAFWTKADSLSLKMEGEGLLASPPSSFANVMTLGTK